MTCRVVALLKTSLCLAKAVVEEVVELGGERDEMDGTEFEAEEHVVILVPGHVEPGLQTLLIPLSLLCFVIRSIDPCVA